MITPAPLFQDHAVLQRDVSVPIWGIGTPEKILTATLGEVSASTRVNSDGSWMLRLPPQSAGGPCELVLRSDSDELRFRDLLLGDVWICSGQSNMEYKLMQVDEDGSQSSGSQLPAVRLLSVATPAKADPQSVVGAAWQLCNPETLARFSAVGGWFGRSLHESLNIPIGLIENAWGGTRIQAWLSREALMTDPAGRKEIAEYEAELYSPAASDSRIYTTVADWFQAEGPEDPVNRGVETGWHQPDFDHTAWERMKLPCRWQDEGFDHSGIFWFRRRVTLPPEWRGKDLSLHLGSADKHDDTYVNGQRVGGIGWENPSSWNTPREYTVSGDLTRNREELLIAVRVRSHQFHGGLIGPASRMNVFPEDQEELAIHLTGDWQYAIEQSWGTVNYPPTLESTGRGPGGHNAPYTLFNSRLHPLIPFGIKGWLWYQGESNAEEPSLYRRQLPLLIQDWRRVWGQGDLPFLIVQLANYKPAMDEPVESSWAELRAAQSAALRIPGVGLAVTIDVGEAGDIHPQNKRTVGERLAHWALAEVYGGGGLPSGPVLEEMSPGAKGRLWLRFRYGNGLCTSDGGAVKRLAIAGSDRNYRWAHSRIDGEQLEVWHPDIQEPAAVRYAWEDNPEGCNLVNVEDLPACPFDSDELERGEVGN